jgi:hypothetical protein
MTNTSSPSPTPASPPPRNDTERSTLFGGVLRHAGRVGREMLSVTVGKWLAGAEPPLPSPTAQPPADPDQPADAAPEKHLNLLHGVAENLRGAADGYIAAKLDEIEARVDQKLDAIESRIDRKIVELHTHLAEMRDRELRHRLRLLKITLIFSALVAALSLLYNWIKVRWLS